MLVKGKITIAELEEGTSPSTGNKWMKCHYVMAYRGRWISGGECTRTLAFSVFGEDRLKELRIHKDEVGTLEFETRGDVKVSQSGRKYESMDIDVLGWKLDTVNTPQEVKSQPRLKPVAEPAPIIRQAPIEQRESSDLPF